VKNLTAVKSDKLNCANIQRNIPAIASIFRDQQSKTIRRPNQENNKTVIISNENIADNSKLSVAFINARSVKNKTFELSELIKDNKLDVLAITESWLSKGSADNVVRGELTPNGYQLVDAPRPKGRGGGLAVVHNSSVLVSQQKNPSVKSFEILELLLKSHIEVIRLGVVYRPPTTSKTGYPINIFLDEFQTYVSSRSTMSGKLLLIGDFNFPYEDQLNSDSKKLRDVLFSLNMEQHVTGVTHTHGHCLDLAITRQGELDITCLEVHGPVTSDHSLITFNLPFSKQTNRKKTMSKRSVKDIDLEDFIHDVSNSEFVVTPAKEIETLAKQYNDCLVSIMDKHAPTITKTVVDRSQSPWFTEKCRKLKVARRKAERCYRKNRLHVHLDIWKNCLHEYSNECQVRNQNTSKEKLLIIRIIRKCCFKYQIVCSIEVKTSVCQAIQLLLH